MKVRVTAGELIKALEAAVGTEKTPITLILLGSSRFSALVRKGARSKEFAELFAEFFFHAVLNAGGNESPRNG
jgi:hypothetical protein